MSKIIKRTAAIGAAVAIGVGVGALAATAPDASAAGKVGTATVNEGRKVVREADKQRCLTLKETRKIVHGNGTRMEGGWYWYCKGKADILIVTFNGSKCAQTTLLGYDNGDAFAWIDGRVLLGLTARTIARPDLVRAGTA